MQLQLNSLQLYFFLAATVFRKELIFIGFKFGVLLTLKKFKLCQKKPIGTTGKTGKICPESGIWKVVETPSTSAPIAQENKFPPYNDKAVTWVLTQYA